MQAQYLIISFSHKTTPITLREKLAIAPDKLESFILYLKEKITSIDELLLVSTCNRVEFYIVTRAPQECIASILSVFANNIGIAMSELEIHCKSALNMEAVHHIFSVVSGLDSVVIGETQIAGQIKSAYRLCFDLGVCGQEITRLIHFAFRTSAKVRNQTLISKAPLSVASVAVKKALEFRESIFTSFTSFVQKTSQEAPKPKTLVLGAGEISQLVVRHLLDSGLDIVLINRTKERALDFIKTLEYEGKVTQVQNTPTQELSKKKYVIQDSDAHIEVFEWTALQTALQECSLVFSATSAQQPIIHQTLYHPCMFQRVWFDLAVPRDINVDCMQDNLLTIFCIDDLKRVIDENLAYKKAQTHQAYGLVGEAVQEYFGWIQSLDVIPLIKYMRQSAKESSLQELERAIKKGYLPKEYEEEVRIILHNAFNVFLHNPTLNLKEFAHHQEGDIIIEAFQKVFKQKDTPKLLNRYKCEYDTTLSL